MNFKQMQQRAKDLGWTGTMIGVKKETLMNFITEREENLAEQQKTEVPMETIQADIEMEERMDDELSPEQQGESPENIITAAQMAEKLGITAKALRRHLRNMEIQKPGNRWAWHPDYAQTIIDTIKSKEKADK